MAQGLGVRLCVVLGLDPARVVKLTIVCTPTTPPTATVEMIVAPQDAKSAALETVVAEYELIPK